MKRLLMISVVMLAVALPICPGSYLSGSANCPSSGNAQVSTTSYFLKQLTVSATATNTGVVSVGGPNVTTSTGTPLLPASSYDSTDTTSSINPATLYFACTVPGDTVSWSGRQ